MLDQRQTQEEQAMSPERGRLIRFRREYLSLGRDLRGPNLAPAELRSRLNERLSEFGSFLISETCDSRDFADHVARVIIASGGPEQWKERFRELFPLFADCNRWIL